MLQQSVVKPGGPFMASPETPLSCKICCGDAADGGPVRCSRQLCFFSGCWGLRCEAQGSRLRDSWCCVSRRLLRCMHLQNLCRLEGALVVHCSLQLQPGSSVSWCAEAESIADARLLAGSLSGEPRRNGLFYFMLRGFCPQS